MDTSALLKLVVAEAETDELRRWLIETDKDLVASDLVRTELFRAVRRTVPDRLVAARSVLEAITILSINSAIFDVAGRLAPEETRSLDAIHLATALAMGDELVAMVTYDNRLADAAETNGLVAIAPR